MPISKDVRFIEDIGKKPDSGVSRSGQEKVLHEVICNPMLDAARKLLMIISAIHIRANKNRFFFITSVFVHLCIS